MQQFTRPRVLQLSQATGLLVSGRFLPGSVRGETETTVFLVDTANGCLGISGARGRLVQEQTEKKEALDISGQTLRLGSDLQLGAGHQQHGRIGDLDLISSSALVISNMVASATRI